MTGEQLEELAREAARRALGAARSLRSRLRAAHYAFVNDSRTELLIGELAADRDALERQLDHLVRERDELVAVATDAIEAAGRSA